MASGGGEPWTLALDKLHGPAATLYSAQRRMSSLGGVVPPFDRYVPLSAHLARGSERQAGGTCAHPSGDAPPVPAPLAHQLARSTDGMRDAVRSVERARLDVRREEAAVRELHVAIRDRQAQAREYHRITAELLRALDEARAERQDAAQLLSAAESEAAHAHARAAQVEAELDALSAERQAALDATHELQLRAAQLREAENDRASAITRARAAAQQARVDLDRADEEAAALRQRIDVEQRAADADEDEAARAQTRAAVGHSATRELREQVERLSLIHI